jgi:hypothetical protein
MTIKRYTIPEIGLLDVGTFVRYEDHVAARKGDANWAKAQSDEIEGLKVCAGMNYERIAELEAQLREQITPRRSTRRGS